MEKKLNELKPGARFTYGGVEWVLLDLKGNHAISITADCVYNRPFDEGNCNDWCKSTLRKELNRGFLSMLISGGADTEAFIKASSDLTPEGGMKTYLFSMDNIALLTCDLYREYRSLLPRIEKYWWVLTPWTNDNEYLYGVCGVTPSGKLDIGTEHKRYGGVRPLCHFNSDIWVSVPDEDAEPSRSNKQAPVKQAVNGMIKILGNYPLELWGDIMGKVFSYTLEQGISQLSDRNLRK